MPKTTIPEKWLKPTNYQVLHNRFEVPQEENACKMMARVSVPFTEGHYKGGGERPNTELADNSPSACRKIHGKY